MEIKLDADAVTAIASAAIFESLDKDARDLVIKQAIMYLLAPDVKHFSGTGATPLQRAFNQAVETAAFNVVREVVADDVNVKAHIMELLGPLVTSTLDVQAQDWRDDFGTAIGKAIGIWLNEQARERA